MSRRILFLHLPNAPQSARLETMPFALNVAESCSAAGHDLSLCLWERSAAPYRALAARGNVRLHLFRDGRLLWPSRLSPLLSTLSAVQVLAATRRRFDFILALGPKGLVIAARLRTLAGGKLVYFNDEFPSAWGDPRLRRAESRAAQHTDAVVVPDLCRAATLLAELGLPPAHPVHALPNAPRPASVAPDAGWRHRLGIPDSRKIILHAGSVAGWALIPEVLSAAKRLPDDVVIVVHSRGGEELDAYRRSLSHLELPGRIFWSTAPVDDAALASMISSSLCTLGLYRNLGPNIEQMGMSSGKIMRSIALGVPVVASRFDSLRFIEEHGLGVLVGDPAELPEAAARISREAAEMREACTRFAAGRLDVPANIAGLWTFLDTLT